MFSKSLPWFTIETCGYKLSKFFHSNIFLSKYLFIIIYFYHDIFLSWYLFIIISFYHNIFISKYCAQKCLVWRGPKGDHHLLSAARPFLLLSPLLKKCFYFWLLFSHFKTLYFSIPPSPYSSQLLTHLFYFLLSSFYSLSKIF